MKTELIIELIQNCINNKGRIIPGTVLICSYDFYRELNAEQFEKIEQERIVRDGVITGAAFLGEIPDIQIIADHAWVGEMVLLKEPEVDYVKDTTHEIVVDDITTRPYEIAVGEAEIADHYDRTDLRLYTDDTTFNFRNGINGIWGDTITTNTVIAHGVEANYRPGDIYIDYGNTTTTATTAQLFDNVRAIVDGYTGPAYAVNAYDGTRRETFAERLRAMNTYGTWVDQSKKIKVKVDGDPTEPEIQDEDFMKILRPAT